MSESPVAGLKDQLRVIEGRLDAAQDNGAREEVKREIIALFKRVDAALTELNQLKDGIRGLAERYKQMNNAAGAAPAGPAPAPQFTGARPAVQADLLGASTFIEKGWSLISLGDHAGAIQALGKALALAPGEVQAQSLLGWAQMLHEDYDDALTTFSKVLMKEPANALARINVGYICLKKRIFGEAIEHLSKAIRLDNDRKATLYAHYYLGLVYLEREMYQDAQSFFGKTLALGPNLIEAYYDMGRAQWVSGDKDGARQSWAQGHKANKFNPWAKRCQEVLDLVAAGGEVPRSLPS
jgi:tetratricopeptide (TPR) repeat protein